MWFFFPYLGFCTAVVLFFSKERGRQPHRLDWARRWGVIASYLMLLLGFLVYATVTGLVLVGIAELFHTLPQANQPAVTELVTKLGTACLALAPTNDELAYAAAAAISGCAVLLACVPIWHALRSIGPKRIGLVLVTLLAIVSVSQVWSGVRWYWDPLKASYEPAPFLFHFYLIASYGYVAPRMSGVWPYLEVAREAVKD